MFGRDDPFGLQVTEAIQETFVNATVKFVVIDHCWHFWHESPQEFYPYLLDFLKISDSAGISYFNLIMECYK